MSDTIQKTITTSWGSRLGASFKGMLFGLVLFVVAFPLLWWNEGRTITTAKALEQGQGAVTDIDSARVDPAFEGQLVHLTGLATNTAPLSDVRFGVTAEALRLERNAEMYQWIEDKTEKTVEKIGGKTETTVTYTYRKDWADRRIDSSHFEEPKGHANPGAMPVESDEWTATGRLGAFSLSESLVRRIGSMQALALPEEKPAAETFAEPAESAEPAPEKAEEAAAASENAEKTAENPEKSAENSEKTAGNAEKTDENAETPAKDASGPIRLADGFYLGKDPAAPAIGDVRVTYRFVPAQAASIVAEQRGDSFAPWKAKNGKTILMVSSGNRTADEMFESAQQGNKFMAWLLRLLGFILMYAGLKMVFAPLATLGAVLPFLGHILDFGTGVVSFLIAMPCSLATIGLAWLFYRPIVGIPLLVAAVALLVLLKRKAKGKKAVEAAAA